MLSQEVAKHLETSPEWQSLKEHIEDCAASLQRIEGIDWEDKERAAIQAGAQQIAYDVLVEILEPFLIPRDQVIDNFGKTKRKTGVL